MSPASQVVFLLEGRSVEDRWLSLRTAGHVTMLTKQQSDAPWNLLALSSSTWIPRFVYRIETEGKGLIYFAQ